METPLKKLSLGNDLGAMSTSQAIRSQPFASINQLMRTAVKSSKLSEDEVRDVDQLKEENDSSENYSMFSDLKCEMSSKDEPMIENSTSLDQGRSSGSENQPLSLLMLKTMGVLAEQIAIIQAGNSQAREQSNKPKFDPAALHRPILKDLERATVILWLHDYTNYRVLNGIYSMVNCLSAECLRELGQKFKIPMLIGSECEDNGIFEEYLNKVFPPESVFKIAGLFSSASVKMTVSNVHNVALLNGYVVKVKTLLEDTTVRQASQEQLVGEILANLQPLSTANALERLKCSTTELLFERIEEFNNKYEGMKSIGLEPVTNVSSNKKFHQPYVHSKHTTAHTTMRQANAATSPVKKNPASKTCNNCDSPEHMIWNCTANFCKKCDTLKHNPHSCPLKPAARVANNVSSPGPMTDSDNSVENLLAEIARLRAMIGDDVNMVSNTNHNIVCSDVSCASVANTNSTMNVGENILADSGCTNTFINDKKYLDNFQSNNISHSNRMVSVANGQLAPIVGSGLFLGMKADLVPSFDNSLISVSQFNSSGNNISLFDSQHMYGITVNSEIHSLYGKLIKYAKDNNLIKLIAHNINGLYKTSYATLAKLNDKHSTKLPCNKNKLMTNSACCNLAVYYTTKMKTLADMVLYFHNAWGHMSKVNMITQVKTQAIQNIPKELTVAAINKHFPPLCVACTKGNLSAVPLPHESTTKYETGEVFELDCKGPYTNAQGVIIPSFTGCIYTITAICVHSRKVIGYPVKNKNNMHLIIEKLVKYVKSKGFTIKILRTDDEYITNSISDYCASENIEQQQCIPYEHGQIGHIERAHRTIEDHIVKSLYDKPHLSDRYWELAYQNALFTMNITPIKSLNNQIPYNLWENRPFDLLVTPTIPFGTIVMAHIPVKLQHALGGRSFETIAVGCAVGFKGGVQLFNPVTKQIIVRRTFKTFGTTVPVTPIYTIAISSNEIDCNPDVTKLVDSGEDVTKLSAIMRTTRSSSAGVRNDNKNQVKVKTFKQPVSLIPNGVEIRNSFDALADIDACDDGTQKNDSQKNVQVPRKGERVRIPSKKYASTYFADNQCTSKHWAAVLRCAAHVAKKCAIDPDFVGIQPIKVPSCYTKALLSPEKKLWEDAKNVELQSFRDLRTFRISDIPIKDIPRELIIPSKIVLDTRYNPDGSFKKAKFRLVARGDLLGKHNVNAAAEDIINAVRNESDVNYAGTVKAESLRIILSIAAEMDLELVSWDVGTAFLHPELAPGEDIYMRRPKGLTDADMPEIVKLNKCIYGLKQASAYFRKHSDNALRSIGFLPTVSDPQVYTKFVGNEYIFISTHVDDFGVAATSLELIASVKKQLSKIYTLTEVPGMQYHLGMHIERDRPNRTIYLSQPAYIEEMLTTFNITTDKDILTPMIIDLHTKQFKNDIDSTLHNNDTNNDNSQLLNTNDKRLYMQKIGTLLYLAISTRPDILYAVTSLSRFSNCPTDVHMKATDRILKYIAATHELKMTLHSGEGVKLYGTVDASYACHKDMKSHTGLTLHIGRHSASIHTITKKQTITADSSTVAEYIAAHHAAKQIVWARSFLKELGFPQNDPTILFEDNMSTIALILKNGNGGKTKHIHVRFQYIREQVRMGNIIMKHLSTKEMTSDMLTKTTGPQVFLHLRPYLLGQSKLNCKLKG